MLNSSFYTQIIRSHSPTIALQVQEGCLRRRKCLGCLILKICSRIRVESFVAFFFGEPEGRVRISVYGGLIESRVTEGSLYRNTVGVCLPWSGPYFRLCTVPPLVIYPSFFLGVEGPRSRCYGRTAALSLFVQPLWWIWAVFFTKFYN
jgi:hypothetical protein